MIPVGPEPGTRTNPLLSVATVAERLGVSVKTVRRHIARGAFPRAVLLGRMVRIPESDVTVLLEERQAKRAA